MELPSYFLYDVTLTIQNPITAIQDKSLQANPVNDQQMLSLLILKNKSLQANSLNNQRMLSHRRSQNF